MASPKFTPLSCTIWVIYMWVWGSAFSWIWDGGVNCVWRGKSVWARGGGHDLGLVVGTRAGGGPGGLRLGYCESRWGSGLSRGKLGELGWRGV